MTDSVPPDSVPTDPVVSDPIEMLPATAGDMAGCRDVRVVLVGMLAFALPTLSNAAEPKRVAVFPVDAFGRVRSLAPELRRALEWRIEQLEHVQLVPSLRVDEALRKASASPTNLEACLSDPSCVSMAGARAGADIGLVGRVASLGPTQLFELRLVDVRLGLVTREVQEELTSKPKETAQRLIETLLPVPADTAWYGTWWFWSGVGTVVLSGFVVAVVLATQSSEPPGLTVDI